MTKKVTYSQVKAGDVIVLDDKFYCIEPGPVEVFEDYGALCFECGFGIHFLASQRLCNMHKQIEDDTLVGVVDHLPKEKANG